MPLVRCGGPRDHELMSDSDSSLPACLVVAPRQQLIQPPLLPKAPPKPSSPIKPSPEEKGPHVSHTRPQRVIRSHVFERNTMRVGVTFVALHLAGCCAVTNTTIVVVSRRPSWWPNPGLWISQVTRCNTATPLAPVPKHGALSLLFPLLNMSWGPLLLLPLSHLLATQSRNCSYRTVRYCFKVIAFFQELSVYYFRHTCDSRPLDCVRKKRHRHTVRAQRFVTVFLSLRQSECVNVRAIGSCVWGGVMGFIIITSKIFGF
jgi:hypothetical protein